MERPFKSLPYSCDPFDVFLFELNQCISHTHRLSLAREFWTLRENADANRYNRYPYVVITELFMDIPRMPRATRLHFIICRFLCVSDGRLVISGMTRGISTNLIFNDLLNYLPILLPKLYRVSDDIIETCVMGKLFLFFLYHLCG